MRKDKRSLLKFALIPLVLLLLMFTTDSISIFGNSSPPVIIINQIVDPSLGMGSGCDYLYLNRTFSSNEDAQEFLLGGETKQFSITVPPGENIYAIIEWNLNFCEPEFVEAGLMIGGPGWDWGGFLCSGEASITLFNAIYTPLEAYFVAPYSNYGEGVNLTLIPGSWTLNMTNDDVCHMCYDLTIRIYGCFNSLSGPEITGPK